MTIRDSPNTFLQEWTFEMSAEQSITVELAHELHSFVFLYVRMSLADSLLQQEEGEVFSEESYGI